ncbi:MAG: hypothetical protein IPG79_19085 [Saprospiraceae bacterium]|nr:hypothetical protein [Saprospiraceae bacterium]
MSDRIKHQIVDAQKKAKDKEIELDHSIQTGTRHPGSKKEEYRRNIAMDLMMTLVQV